MAGDDKRFQDLSIRMDTARRRDNTIKIMPLKIDDRSLVNGTYRSGYDRQSYQPPPHRPPPHHPPLSYLLQHSQLSEFFYEEELCYPTYQYNVDYEDERMVHERRKRFANPNPKRRDEFSNSNRRNMLPNSICDQGGGNSNFGEFSNYFPSFDGSHDIESTLLWINEVGKLFGMEYIPIEDHIEFAAHKLKGRTSTWWNQFQNIYMYQCKSLIRTWRRVERLLQARSLTLEEEEMENQSYMRFYRSNKTAQLHQQPPVEEPLTKGDSSNLQATISQA